MTKTVTTGKATDLITFTRSSTGTYLDSVKYGDELITNGDFSKGAQNWTEEHGGGSGTPSASIDNGVATLTGYAFPSHASIVQVIQTVAGETYRYSANITDNNAFLIAVNNVNQSGIITYAAPKSGVITITFVAPSDSTKIILRSQDPNGTPSVFDNVSVKQIIGNQGTSGEPLLRTADTHEPRIEYDADGNLKGLLVEAHRTNLVMSSDYSKTHDRTTSGDVTLTELNENKLGVFEGLEVASGGQTWHRVNKYVSVTSGTTYAVSFYYRYGTSGKGRFECRVSGNSSTIVTNQATGSAGTGGTSGGTLEFLTDEAFGDIRKLTCRWTPNATSTTATVGIATNSGVVGENIIAYAVQCEVGAFATSYIPTVNTTVSRNADVASLNASLFEYNGNEGTTLIEFDKANWAYTTTFLRAYSWGHGSQSVDILNDIYNYGNSAPNSGKIRFRVDDSSGNAVFGANFVNGSESDNTAKVALALKDNDMAIAWDGTVPHTDTTGIPAINLVTALYIGSKFNEVAGGGVSDYINGHIKSIKYYPVRLTNDEIKALTL